MYVPASFEITDGAIIRDIIRRNSFALLVSDRGGEPFATHLPLLFRPDEGPHGTLHGHLARANPHAELLAGRRTLAVFSGPHAYVSPTWYETPNTVPTWNYVAVHAYGTCELITEAEPLLRLLSETVSTYESNLPTPWSFDPKDEHARKLLAGIVGFRIPVDRLEGKAKLNQNHPPERRAQVAAILEQSADPDSLAIAHLMRKAPK